MSQNLQNKEHIRNFSIIAHIDHGKSTLADRILEITGALTQREQKEQFLDKMEIERERGITIKAQTVRLNYKSLSGKDYQINLIDTPGHVDFSYEVSRSLAACEGAILVVDASQGVEAQTLANVYLAVDNNLEIVPVLNKIDLPTADPSAVKQQIREIIGLPTENIILCSAKTGVGIQDIMEAIIQYVPPPYQYDDNVLKALIFDSWFDPYLGVICLVRVMEGKIRLGQKILFMSNKKVFEVTNTGVFNPHPAQIDGLSSGEVGFFAAAIKEVRDVQVGDTVTDANNPTLEPIQGFKPTKSMVFAGIFPTNSSEYENLKTALEKLRLNDAAFQYEPETSSALGFGFRCGFLGLLHMEIIQERLDREFEIDIITTAPTVVYKVTTVKGETISIDNPSKLPKPTEIEEMAEPYVNATFHLPTEYIGPVIQLCEERRGIQKNLQYIGTKRAMLNYEMPFGEIMFDFFDKLKSISKGYASFDYEFIGYRVSNLVKVDVLINGDAVDALSVIIHRDWAYPRGRALIQKMRETIPRQSFEVAIQAAIGSKIIARETVKPFRKDVLAKCYGGDISRKRKLLEKQKEGKKRMKQVGNVEIPQEAFLAILKLE